MSREPDVFSEINNALLDLQQAQLQTYARPLKNLHRLLQSADLQAINRQLTAQVDYDAFIATSSETQGGMVGSGQLLWPDDPAKVLGLTLIMIEKMAEDPDQAINLGHEFFYSGNKVMGDVHALTRQLLIPFARDYKAYVLNHGPTEPRVRRPASNKVFIVHGHDDAALQGLARFLEKLGLDAIILMEQPDQGRTIIEKFEDSAADVGFAVVLLTPDDLGGLASAEDQRARARQNVIFELGYFAGQLGRGRVCLLRKGDVEIPSDLFGVIYTAMDSAEGWKSKLIRELKAAGLDFDAGKLWH